MRLFFVWATLCVLLLPATALSQHLKNSKRKNSDDSVEKFTVLKSEPEIRHGAYTKINANGDVVTSGFYKNGKKDSVWTQFYSNKTPAARGHFLNDAKHGSWQFYSRDGTLIQRYNYTTSRLEYNATEADKPAKIKVIIGRDTLLTTVDRPAVLLGADHALNTYLGRTLRYPAMAREEGIEGIVVVAFFITAEGIATGFRVVKHVGGGCSEEALRVVSGFKGDWIPAEKDGKPVTSEFTIPVGFQLSSN